MEKSGWERFWIFLETLIRDRSLRAALVVASDAVANLPRFMAFQRRFSEEKIKGVEVKDGETLYIIGEGFLQNAYREKELRLVERGNIWKFLNNIPMVFGVYPEIEEARIHVTLGLCERGLIFKAYDYHRVAQLALSGKLDFMIKRVSADMQPGEQFVAIKINDVDVGNRVRRRIIEEYANLLLDLEQMESVLAEKYSEIRPFDVQDYDEIYRLAATGKIDWVVVGRIEGDRQITAIKMDDAAMGEKMRQILLDAYKS